MDLQESDLKVYEIPMGEIFCDNVFNCRGPIQPREVDDLTRSIGQIGLQQPIIVQVWDGVPGKKYRIISGHRRWTSFKVMMKATIPAIVRQSLSELQAKKLNLEENLKRKDLNILQEAQALQPFLRAGWTLEQVAREFSQTIPWVDVRKKLLHLPEDIQQDCAAGFLNQTHIAQIAQQIKGKPNDRSAIDEAIRRIKTSKQLGEKKKIEIGKKKVKPYSKAARSRADIFEMMNILQEVFGNSLTTRLLAWAAGEISLIEVHQDIKRYAAEAGITYSIPREVLEAL